MRRFLIVSTIVVAMLWVAVVAARLLLPSGAHLVGMADSILYWVAVVATAVLVTIGFYALLRHQPLLARIAGWAFYFLLGLEGMFFAAIFGAMCFDEILFSKPYQIDNRYLVRKNLWEGSVLYERQSMVERRVSALQYGYCLDETFVDNIRVAICPKHNVLLIECDEPRMSARGKEATPRHRCYLQSLDGHCYTDAETLDLLERCPEIKK